MNSKRLNVFVAFASECLTDHLSHGDGLICHRILHGLATRGHRIFAYTSHAEIRSPHPNLVVRVRTHRSPADSLAMFEHYWRARQWMQELRRTTPIDVVWRMHPYGITCPVPPWTGGRPLIVGPVYRGWPVDELNMATAGRPRYGVSLAKWIEPIAESGWQRTLRRSSLLLASTPAHARAMAAATPSVPVVPMPVIIDAPDVITPWAERGPVQTLIFAANFLPQKRPHLFVDLIAELTRRGLAVRGVMLGDGPLRNDIESRIASTSLSDRITCVGRVPSSDVAAYLGRAHWHVSTSYGEPYGRSIVEAMALGTPNLCHRSGGPADFIGHGENGLLAESLSGSAYADAISPALSDPAIGTRLAQNARNSAAEWSESTVITTLERALGDVVGGHR
jgi:glycosyltransferase involved in cell wall biosynthesis